MAQKLAHLRVFSEGERLLHLSLLDTGFEALVVSQFTILGDCRKGRRPSFDLAGPPELAEKLYEDLVAALTGPGAQGGHRPLPPDDGGGADQRRPGDPAPGHQEGLLRGMEAGGSKQLPAAPELSSPRARFPTKKGQATAASPLFFPPLTEPHPASIKITRTEASSFGLIAPLTGHQGGDGPL